MDGLLLTFRMMCLEGSAPSSTSDLVIRLPASNSNTALTAKLLGRSNKFTLVLQIENRLSFDFSHFKFFFSILIFYFLLLLSIIAFNC